MVTAATISDWGWADYGLAGLMVGGLLLFLVFISKQHREERTEWRKDMDSQADRHREERVENRKANERQSDKLNQSMQMLERAIRDQGK